MKTFLLILLVVLVLLALRHKKLPVILAVAIVVMGVCCFLFGPALYFVIPGCIFLAAFLRITEGPRYYMA